MNGDLDTLRLNIRKLLNQIGAEMAVCRGCQAQIWWVTHANGKRAPYTQDALNHFADCPKAGEFRKGAK